MSSFDDREGKAPFGAIFDPNVPQSQIPYRYQVLKERARLATCCYWRDPEDSRSAEEQVLEDGIGNVSPELPLVFEFTTLQLVTGTLDGPLRTAEESIAGHRPTAAEENLSQPITVMGGWLHESSPSFYIKPGTLETVLVGEAGSVPTKCTKEGAEPWHQGNNGFPPCNGAATECPFYTGPRFKYVKDEDIYIGEQILAEQIQELRFLSRDWSQFGNPEEAWNQLYEEPDIFARAHNPPEDLDSPVISSEVIDGTQQALSEMTRVRWDHSLNDVVRTKVLSSPPGTSEELNDIVSTPSFYTLIKNIGESTGNPIRIQFPPNEEVRESSDTDEHGPIRFTYEHSVAFSDIIYLAGTAVAQTTLFIVNTSIHQDFPYDENSLLNNEIVSPLIDDLITDYFTQTNLRGFRVNKVDVTGFWQEFFADINPGLNKIVVLSQIDGNWSFARVEIDYKFYHMEFIQNGYESGLVDGQVPLISYLANSRPSTDIIFQGHQMGNEVALIDSVYHFYVQERDLFRLCVEDSPNRRTFKFTKEEITEEVNFFRIGNCNSFMCEITGRDVPTASPIGLDRSMEITRVVMHAVMDSDSGHGEEEEVDIEMDVVPFRGRNVRGISIPVRFFRVEPINDTDIRKLDVDRSSIEVTYFIFRGESLSSDLLDGRIEATDELIENFKDNSFFSGSIGGFPIFSLDEEMVPSTALEHSPLINGDNVNAGLPQKADMSYVVQFRSSITGNLIGKKWIYGIAELSKFWARDIEIRYSWCSDYSTLTSLLPAWRKFGLDVEFSELGDEHRLETGRCRRTQCGDHETSSLGEGGPSFYPYDGCTQPLYTNRDVARWLFQPVPDVEPIDEKYRAPDLYEYKTLEHHVFGFLRPDCFMEWSMGTINNIGAVFNGYSRPRGPISPLVRPLQWLKYIIRGWKLPPLGNRGREVFRIGKTMHYQQYIQKCNNLACGFCVRLGWLPTVTFPSNSDFLVENSPRTVLDQTYKSTNTLERKKWGEVYYLRNTIEPERQGRPAQPVQWPRRGYHPNFKKPEYVWAWQERITDLERGDEPIAGVRITKPIPEVLGQTVSYVGNDALSRPINFHPHEDDVLELKLFPEEYSETQGVFVERAHFILGEEGEKLYFNEITGEIEADSGAPEPERLQIYAINSKSELLDAGINPSTNEIYTDRVGAEGENPPENLEHVDTYISTGNLISNPSQIDIFLTQADILGEEEESYAGFYRALSISDIFPKFLPRIETPLDEREDLYARVLITDYPDINPGIGLNRNFSNQNLTLDRTRILGSAGVMQWNPNDPGDLNSGQIAGFTIRIQFNRRVMLSKIQMNYEVFGGLSHGPVPVGQLPAQVAPSIDPSITITAFNTVDATEKVIFDKKAFNKPPRFLPNGLDPVRREHEFVDEFENKEFFDRVEISVGPRNDETGFRITDLEMNALFIKEASELIDVKEAKYVVEIQSQENPPPFNYPAEDDFEQESYFKMAFGIDTSDILELNGLAEFWQPSIASTSADLTVGTLGRIRREWANGWDTADVALHLGEISNIVQYPRNTVRGGDVVDDHENRQVELMQAALETAINDGVDIEQLSALSTADDLKFFRFIHGLEDILLPYDGTIVRFDGGLNRFLSILRNVISVPLGEQPPGWQAEGFWACLGERAKTRILDSPNVGHCNNLGGGDYGVYTPEWNTTHGVCGKNVGDPSNSDNPNYFGGISIGDLGFYQTRRLILSGGDAGASMADPTGSFVASDGASGSIQDAINQDRLQDIIASEGANNIQDDRGLPPPPSGPRGSRS